MTNTAVQRIVQKTSSPLVIARCPAEAIKIINTQRNHPMCIDIFLYPATARPPSARPAASATRCRPRNHSWGTGLQRPAPPTRPRAPVRLQTPQRGSRQHPSARGPPKGIEPDISLFVTTNRRHRRAPAGPGAGLCDFAYTAYAKVTQSRIGTPMGYPAGQPQAAISSRQELHSRRSQRIGDWRTGAPTPWAPAQHQVASRRQPGVPRPDRARGPVSLPKRDFSPQPNRVARSSYPVKKLGIC